MRLLACEKHQMVHQMNGYENGDCDPGNVMKLLCHSMLAFSDNIFFGRRVNTGLIWF